MAGGSFILKSDGKFALNADGTFNACSLTGGVALTLAGVDAARCTPCVQEGATAFGWDVSSLAVNGTYTLPASGAPSSIWPFNKTTIGTGFGHAKEYVFDVVCGALIEESDSASSFMQVVVDCSDKNAACQPRIFSITVDVNYPGGFPAAGTAPSQIFRYSKFVGGTHYVGDGSSIANQLATCGSPVGANGGTAMVAIA